MERLGDTVEFGEQLLGVLEAAGWDVYRLRAFAGEGVMVIAAKGPFRVAAVAPTAAAAATNAFLEAATYYSVREAA